MGKIGEGTFLFEEGKGSSEVEREIELIDTSGNKNIFRCELEGRSEA